MFEGLLTLLNKLPYGSGKVIEAPEPEPKTVFPDYIPPIETPLPKQKPHAMTIDEYQDYYDSVRIGQEAGRILRNLHNRRHADQQHEELMSELRSR